MKKYIIFAAAALSLAACTNEVEENFDDTPVAAQISAGVNTRADNDKWEADVIGVMVTGGNNTMKNLYKNVQYITTANSTGKADFTVPERNDPIYFKGTETAIFAAYGPYEYSASSGWPGNNGVIEGSTDSQSTREKQKAFDYIYASGATGSLDNPEVKFSFKHVMARLVINIKASDKSGITVNDLSSSKSEYYLGGFVHKGEFDVITGEAKTDGSASKVDSWELHSKGWRTVGTDGITFTSILYPQTIAQLTFKADLNGVVYNVTPLSLNLEAGKSYTINITVKKAELEMTGSTISEWNEEGKTNVDATI